MFLRLIKRCLSGTGVKILLLVDCLINVWYLLLSSSLSSQHYQLKLYCFCRDLRIATWQLWQLNFQLKNWSSRRKSRFFDLNTRFFNRNTRFFIKKLGFFIEILGFSKICEKWLPRFSLVNHSVLKKCFF